MSERENWEGASDDELHDGIDDGNSDAIAEYGSRLYQDLQRARALLRRWARHAGTTGLLASLRYETLRYLDPEAYVAPPTPQEGER